MDPLHLAVEKGHIAVICALIKAGADVNTKKKGGWTPLHFSASKGYQTVTKRLLSAGADIHAKNLFEELPVELILNILRFVDAPSFFRVRQVSRLLHNCASDASFPLAHQVKALLPLFENVPMKEVATAMQEIDRTMQVLNLTVQKLGPVMRELDSIVRNQEREDMKALSLGTALRNHQQDLLDNQVLYMGAIFLHKGWYQLVLKYQFEAWFCIVRNVMSKMPEIIPSLLGREAFKEQCKEYFSTEFPILRELQEQRTIASASRSL